MLSMNQRLKQNLKKKGVAAAKKWAKEYKENERNFDAAKYAQAKKEVQSLYINY